MLLIKNYLRRYILITFDLCYRKLCPFIKKLFTSLRQKETTLRIRFVVSHRKCGEIKLSSRFHFYFYFNIDFLIS